MRFERLILFDIDGTLIRGGPAKKAFAWGLENAYGTAGPIDAHDFAGKTDPQIARELLSEAGLASPRIEEGLARALAGYLARMAEWIVREPVEVLPGAEDAVEALARAPEVALGVLTGNIFEGARLKLRSARLWSRFPVGAFGSDASERDDLPPHAMRRAHACWQTRFHPGRTVIVGDTPRDIACAKTHDIMSIAVTTGRHDAQDLKEADLVIEGLFDLREALDSLLGPC